MIEADEWTRLFLEHFVEKHDFNRARIEDFIVSIQADVSESCVAQYQKFQRLDMEASKYVESVICMRTGFTGEPPYVGWQGLGLALTEALDQRDYLLESVKYAIKLLRLSNSVAAEDFLQRVVLQVEQGKKN